MAYRNPGDVEVHALTIVNFDGSDKIDLRKIAGEINLYEDIMSNTMYGNMVIYDAIDMVQDFPIIGEETLKLHFNVPGERKTAINRFFRVYKLTDRKRDKNDTSAAYTLHFTTREEFEVLNKNIQKAFTGQSISEMVQKIYDNYIFDIDNPKDIVVEETVGTHDIIIPNMNPFKAMNYLSKRAESDKNPASNFVFFEDHHGFKFNTIEHFIKQPSKETFFYKHTGTGYKTEGNKDAFIIENMTQHQTFDVLKNLMNGMYSNKVLTHDIIRKTHQTHSFDYVSDYDTPNRGHLKREKQGGKFTSEKANFLSKAAVDVMLPTQLNQPINKYIAGKDFTIRPKKTEIFGMVKQSTFSQLDTVVMNITVPGDHNRMPGDVITLVLPTATGVRDLQGPDKYYSGDYLITQVRHKINLDQYSTILQCVKESYGVSKIESSPNKVGARKTTDENLNVDIGVGA